MTSPDQPRFGLLALVTYGIVFLFTGLAVGVYYYLDSQRPQPESSVADTRTVQVGGIWVPAYPGAALRPPEVATRGDTVDGTMEFSTADPAPQVVSYFESVLARTGYQVTTTPVNAAGGTVQAIRQGGRLRVVVTAEASREGAQVTIRTLARSDAR